MSKRELTNMAEHIARALKALHERVERIEMFLHEATKQKEDKPKEEV